MDPTNNWSSKQQKQFINLLRKNPILWNTEHPEFIDKDKREEAWSSIQAAMGLPRLEIKAKLWSLRSKYCEIYKKLIDDSNYKPTWKFFNALKFLFKHNDDDVQDSVESLTEDEQIKADNESDLDLCASFIDENDDKEESHILYDEDNSIETSKLKDEYTVFGESIANELRIMNNFKTVKLAFKAKVMTAILEANEAVKRRKLECYEI